MQPAIWIDHVLFSARDLDACERRLLDEFGLAAYDGGVHGKFGTANRIVPLGNGYLELLGVADETIARANPIGRWALDAVARPDGPLHWNVGVRDLGAAAERLGLDIEPGTRTLPDGSSVTFEHLSTAQGVADPLLPLYIAWTVPAEGHPQARSVPHRIPVTGIAWLELAVADALRAARLEAWIDGAELPLRLVRDEPEGLRAVGIAVEDGPDLVLR